MRIYAPDGQTLIATVDALTRIRTDLATGATTLMSESVKWTSTGSQHPSEEDRRARRRVIEIDVEQAKARRKARQDPMHGYRHDAEEETVWAHWA